MPMNWYDGLGGDLERVSRELQELNKVATPLDIVFEAKKTIVPN